MICTCGFAQENAIGKMGSMLKSRSISEGPISTHHLTPAAAKQMEAISRQPRRAASVQRPATQPRPYAMSGYFFTYAGMVYASGIAQQVAVDGKNVYISNLFPIMLEEREAWTKGELNEAGNKISIPVQHIYDEDWYAEGTDVEFYMGDVVFSDEGDITEVRPFEFDKDGDYIYMDDLKEVNEEGYAIANHHIGIFAYSNEDQSIQLYDYVAGHKLSPYEPGKLVECPADARVENYLYRGLDDYGDAFSNMFQVAFSGNDVYFNGLTPDQPGWVHGTIGDDNVVTIPTGQYVGIQKYFYTYFAAMVVAGYDDYGNATFHLTDNLVLQYDPEAATFTFIDPNLFIGELIYEGNNRSTVQAAFGELKLEPVGEAKAATPTAPYDLFVMDLEDYGFDQWDFGFMLDLKGSNDEYLFPDNLKVAMFMDDKLFTFDPVNYEIVEPITFIGYNDIDSNDAYYHDMNIFDLYVNKSFDFRRLGAVAIYTVDGETRYSDVAYIQLLPENITYEPLTEAQLAQLNEHFTDAIRQVKDDSQRNAYFYNLQGQRVSNPKGLVIYKNKKIVIK